MVCLENTLLFCSAEKLFGCGKLAAQGKQLHGKVKFLNRREGGRKTDVFILGILSVREGSACVGKLYAGLIAK